MPRPPLDQTPIYGPKGPPLTVKQSANRAGVSVPQYWKTVDLGVFPAPVYPSPRSPRWFGPEIDAALEKQRRLPRENKRIRAEYIIAQRNEVLEFARQNEIALEYSAVDALSADDLRKLHKAARKAQSTKFIDIAQSLELRARTSLEVDVAAGKTGQVTSDSKAARGGPAAIRHRT